MHVSKLRLCIVQARDTIGKKLPRVLGISGSTAQGQNAGTAGKVDNRNIRLCGLAY